jgi:hypothetical protein
MCRETTEREQRPMCGLYGGTNGCYRTGFLTGVNHLRNTQAPLTALLRGIVRIGASHDLWFGFESGIVLNALSASPELSGPVRPRESQLCGAVGRCMLRTRGASKFIMHTCQTVQMRSQPFSYILGQHPAKYSKPEHQFSQQCSMRWAFILGPFACLSSAVPAMPGRLNHLRSGFLNDLSGWSLQAKAVADLTQRRLFRSGVSMSSANEKWTMVGALTRSHPPTGSGIDVMIANKTRFTQVTSAIVVPIIAMVAMMLIACVHLEDVPSADLICID